MNPCPHREFRDEDIAALCEEDGCFGGYHFDFGIGLHNFLDARQGQLMQLVVMVVAFQMVDGLLPIGCQDVLVLAGQALMNLSCGECASVDSR